MTQTEEIVKEKYVAVIFYIGHDFCGWQTQTPANTNRNEEQEGGKEKRASIQDLVDKSVRDAIPSCLGVSSCASGRTDAEQALMQVDK